MARTADRAKPQRQAPNLANEHQTFGCQLGTQMAAVFVRPPLPSTVRAQLLLRAAVLLVLQQKEDKQINLSSKKLKLLLLTPPPHQHQSSGNNQLLCWASVQY